MTDLESAMLRELFSTCQARKPADAEAEAHRGIKSAMSAGVLKNRISGMEAGRKL
jgi:hypothetical protein